MELFYRILNFKFMHILCFSSIGRKYFVIFTWKLVIKRKNWNFFQKHPFSTSFSVEKDFKKRKQETKK